MYIRIRKDILCYYLMRMCTFPLPGKFIQIVKRDSDQQMLFIKWYLFLLNRCIAYWFIYFNFTNDYAY